MSSSGVAARSKGISGVEHPAGGIFCSNPDQNLPLSRIVPSVSVQWDFASGDALSAHWRRDPAEAGCQPGRIAVQTLNGDDGSFDKSDSVSFTVVVL